MGAAADQAIEGAHPRSAGAGGFAGPSAIALSSASTTASKVRSVEAWRP
jgi:hypothetical protein